MYKTAAVALVATLGMGALSGCSSVINRVVGLQSKLTTTNYQCADGFQFSIETIATDKVTITDRSNGKVTLSAKPVAVGAKYVGPGYTLWLKGPDGTVVIDGNGQHGNCVPV